MWPIHGNYRCRTCGRFYAVPWADNGRHETAHTKVTAGRPARALSVFVPLIVLLTLLPASRARAADQPVVDSTAGASMAFARYTANLRRPTAWGVETVEIEASMPKLQKAARLRAIRRLLPMGRPEYQVLETEGDKTVKQQVIVRYLSADITAAAMPVASVAITPENYRFRYKGATAAGGSTAYVFLITPRKKREGLIKGELWLDGDSGAVVRQSGCFVKEPSIFVKRVEFTREMVLRDGIVGARVTHLVVLTRLMGLAELTVWERPFDGADPAAGLNIGEPTARAIAGAGMQSLAGPPAARRQDRLALQLNK